MSTEERKVIMGIPVGLPTLHPNMHRFKQGTGAKPSQEGKTVLPVQERGSEARRETNKRDTVYVVTELQHHLLDRSSISECPPCPGGPRLPQTFAGPKPKPSAFAKFCQWTGGAASGVAPIIWWTEPHTGQMQLKTPPKSEEHVVATHTPPGSHGPSMQQGLPSPATSTLHTILQTSVQS